MMGPLTYDPVRYPAGTLSQPREAAGSRVLGDELSEGQHQFVHPFVGAVAQFIGMAFHFPIHLLVLAGNVADHLVGFAKGLFQFLVAAFLPFPDGFNFNAHIAPKASVFGVILAGLLHVPGEEKFKFFDAFVDGQGFLLPDGFGFSTRITQ